MIILGEEEVKQGVVKIKDMTKRTEEVRPASRGKTATVHSGTASTGSVFLLRTLSLISTAASL